MNLSRPLVIFDLETTGTDPREDRIVQLAMQKLTPGEDPLQQGAFMVDNKKYLFDPGRPIPPEATKIHGITDAMVSGQPRFASRAKAMCAWLDGCDFAGYNIRRFDLPMLYEECKRAGTELPVKGAAIVDVATLYFMLNPRSLEDAARRYAEGFEFKAHDAAEDVEATRRVLAGILDHEEELPRDPGALSQLCDEEWGPCRLREVERWFDWTDDGQPIFLIGKHKGELVAEADDGYIAWMRREIKDDEVLQVINLVMTAAVSDIRQNVLDPPQQDLNL